MAPFPPAHDGAPAVGGITGADAARGFDTLLRGEPVQRGYDPARLPWHQRTRRGRTGR
jgi:hypothetical protein